MLPRVAPRLLLLAAAIASAAGCAELDTTGADAPLKPQQNAFANGLASTGWQEHARSLVAANIQSPLVAARVYAALGVAQYAAVNDVAALSTMDGNIPDNGFGKGGRARYEAERGAVAGASVGGVVAGAVP